MRKLLLLSLISITIILGCKPDTKELDNLKLENEKLNNELLKRDSTVNDMFKTFDNIQQNLSEIRAKEMVINKTTQTTKELDENSRNNIINEIQMINELIDKNKKTIASLRAQIKKSNMKISAFEKTIKDLEKQIEDKDKEITELKDKLEKLNFTVEELNVKVETLTTQNTEKTEIISKQTEELNMAWYVLGSSKELIEKEVITREGGVIGIGKSSKLSKEVKKEYFTKIDIRNVKEIPISSKKAKILSTHPQSSFDFKKEDNVFISLIITDAKKFWSISKYLVIEI